ncbi:Gfo/Idh/MocA family oxidoreductase [Roseibium denhamense]|uniref:Predicted dehydrogenase n=1 Tax=Roseibium denhamense TaxID=76305 RepID=A0ABY1PKK5_9HYPH|nr:Gfo/Idh/MocA family oxidoreductase [Roseibium denhamense]MTI05848.1 Gfo/Idh/MocA family oxidoreductase [Roseibium denhamense]SMP35473.1 Predicted dehydrogenase [Roseibium denhamense]
MKNGAQTLRVACLGAGYFAQFHYDAWRRNDRIKLVGACDRDQEKAKATGLAAFSSLDTMLKMARPDLLDVITPPHTHLEAITLAIANGVRIIICQKPFCGSLAEAKEAVKRTDEAGATLVIHENFRFQPWYRTFKQAIDSGLLGNVLQLTFRLRTGDGQGPDAYLDRQPYFQTMPKLLIHETGVHWIDTFRYLLGDPEAVYADLRRLNPVIEGEDAGYFVFDYKNGVRALFDGNRLLDHAADNCRTTLGEAIVEGTEGTLTLCGDGSVRLRNFGSLKESTLLEAKTWQGFGGDCVKALIDHVVDGVLDGKPLENRARDYLRVIAIERAIYESDRVGRKIWEFADA